jgi:hypothetical protein
MLPSQLVDHFAGMSRARQRKESWEIVSIPSFSKGASACQLLVTKTFHVVQVITRVHSFTQGKASHLYSLTLGVMLTGPFSHRTMLTLEEKGIPYNKMLIDELNMPDWYTSTDAAKTIFIRHIVPMVHVLHASFREAVGSERQQRANDGDRQPARALLASLQDC